MASHLRATVDSSQVVPLGGDKKRLGKLQYLSGGRGDIRKIVSYGVANCALGYFGVLLLDP